MEQVEKLQTPWSERTMLSARTYLGMHMKSSHTALQPWTMSSRPTCRYDRCALVLVMPARPRFAISGILAGGIPGFGIAFSLLGTPRFIL